MATKYSEFLQALEAYTNLFWKKSERVPATGITTSTTSDIGSPTKPVYFKNELVRDPVTGYYTIHPEVCSINIGTAANYSSMSADDLTNWVADPATWAAKYGSTKVANVYQITSILEGRFSPEGAFVPLNGTDASKPVTGVIRSNSDVVLSKQGDSSVFKISGGTTLSNGASLLLSGGSSSLDADIKLGGFKLQTKNSTYKLTGTYDGHLKWNGVFDSLRLGGTMTSEVATGIVLQNSANSTPLTFNGGTSSSSGASLTLAPNGASGKANQFILTSNGYSLIGNGQTLSWGGVSTFSGAVTVNSTLTANGVTVGSSKLTSSGITANAFKTGSVTIGSSIALGNTSISGTSVATQTVTATTANLTTIGVTNLTASGTVTGATVKTSGVTMSASGLKVGSTTVNGSSVTATTFNGTATRANWADLAEIYKSDKNYAPGTLVKFGGESEITIASDGEVNGVISEKPGYLLNSKCEGLPVALSGRVEVLVKGRVKKSDKLVLSDIDGVAEPALDNTKKVFAIALEDKASEEVSTVECVVKLTF